MSVLTILKKFGEMIIHKKAENKTHNDLLWVIWKVNKWFKHNMHKRGKNVETINHNNIRF